MEQSIKLTDQKEKFQDWLFRYQYVYRVRRTQKSKQRFLSALVTDISAMGKDIKVMEYNRQKKYAARNVYVGDLKKADQIICAYYDTPPKSFGSYVFFDRDAQKKQTTGFMLIAALFMVVVGVSGTMLYMRYDASLFDLTSLQTWLAIIAYGIYFFLFGKVTKGLAKGKTLVRNTSSILAMLALMAEKKDSKTAFAFLDEGSYGETGLTELRSQLQHDPKIILLDCIGANAPLQLVGQGISQTKLAKQKIEHYPKKTAVSYLFSGHQKENAGKDQFYLTKNDLNQKNLNLENIEKVLALLQ